MKKIIIISILLVFNLKDSKSQTFVSNLITNNQTWTKSGNPYILTQNTYIDTGVTVKVLPGVIIKSNFYKITVQGSFECYGKQDSLINIDTITIEFGNKSKDYNIINGNGAYFNYTKFNYISSSSIPYCIISNSTSLKVENSIFNLGYYGIYLNNSIDSTLIEVKNSKFFGSNTFGSNSGYPLYGNTSKSFYKIYGNEFHQLYSIYIGGNIDFEGNYINDIDEINMTQYFGNFNIICNKFLNMGRNIILNSSNVSKQVYLNFKSNSLNNLCNENGFNNYFMLNINRYYPSNTIIDITNNNFLIHGGRSNNKLKITGKIGGPSSIDSIFAKNNYWNTSDSNNINTYLYDFADDFNLPRVIFSKFELTPNVNCTYPFECPIPGFIYQFSNFNINEVIFTDLTVNNNKFYKVKWKFGDGDSAYSNAKEMVTHQYRIVGSELTVCMYITDSFDNICDSACQLISIPSCKPSFYFGIDTTNKKKIYVINNSKTLGSSNNLKYYWEYGSSSGPFNYSSQKTPPNTLANKDKFIICLTIWDSTIMCYGTHCDTINIDSNNTEIQFINDINLSNDKANLDNGNIISLYPNPNNGKFGLNINLKENQIINLNLFNVVGQNFYSNIIQMEGGENSIDLDFQDLSNGIYFISISSESFSKVLKIKILK